MRRSELYAAFLVVTVFNSDRVTDISTKYFSFPGGQNQTFFPRNVHTVFDSSILC